VRVVVTRLTAPARQRYRSIMPPLPSGMDVLAFPCIRGVVGPVVDLVGQCGTSFSV
jgi:hypothetical protein